MFATESATMNPYHHGQSLVLLLGRSYHAEVEAVLVHHVVFHVTLFWLWRPLGRLFGFEHTIPRLCRLRCLPTQVANRRSCKRNGIITGEVIAFEYTLYITRFYVSLQ